MHTVSLAINSQGNPCVSFFTGDPSGSGYTTFEYGVYDGTTWNYQKIGEASHIYPIFTNLALDPSGQPHILYSYHDFTVDPSTQHSKEIFILKYASLQQLPSLTALPSLMPPSTPSFSQTATPIPYHFDTPNPSTVQALIDTVAIVGITVLVAIVIIVVIIVAVVIVSQRKTQNNTQAA